MNMPSIRAEIMNALTQDENGFARELPWEDEFPLHVGGLNEENLRLYVLRLRRRLIRLRRVLGDYP